MTLHPNRAAFYGLSWEVLLMHCLHMHAAHATATPRPTRATVPRQRSGMLRHCLCDTAILVYMTLQNGKSHPEAISHHIMGDVIAHGLIAALRDSSMAQGTSQDASCAAWKAPTKFHQNLAPMQYCTPPNGSDAAAGTFMSDVEPSSFTPLERGNWLWREDVPGKPGTCAQVHTPASGSPSA